MALLAPGSGGKAASGRAHPGGIHYARGANPAAVTTSPDMVDFGGAGLPTTTTYAIWWRQPFAILEDLEGSAYLGIANQYILGHTALVGQENLNEITR